MINEYDVLKKQLQARCDYYKTVGANLRYSEKDAAIDHNAVAAIVTLLNDLKATAYRERTALDLAERHMNEKHALRAEVTRLTSLLAQRDELIHRLNGVIAF